MYLVLQQQDDCVLIGQTLIGWRDLTDTTAASQRVCVCLKQGVNVCTCVSVETIYCDDVNSESNCRLTLNYTVYQSAKHKYLFIALFIDFLYCWIIYWYVDSLQKSCRDPELNTTANCCTQWCVQKRNKKETTLANHEAWWEICVYHLMARRLQTTKMDSHLFKTKHATVRTFEQVVHLLFNTLMTF